MIPMAIFAGKGPKGKLLSYSHTSVNPEMALNSKFDLSWYDGKGTLTINEMLQTNEYKFTAEADEHVFSIVDDIIRERTLYDIGKKKKKKKASAIPLSDPGQEEYCIRYEKNTYCCDAGNLSDEQHTAFHELEELIKDLIKCSRPPEGNLVECRWTCKSPLPGKGDDFECLSAEKGQIPVLTIGNGSPTPHEEQFIVADQDMKTLNNIIISKELYKVNGYNGKDLSGKSPENCILLRYDNREMVYARWSHQFPPREVVEAVSSIRDYFSSLARKANPPFPEGKMVYCSCSYTNYGLPVGEIQRSYYELIADEGMSPKVVFCEDRGDSEKTEYEATEQDAETLSQLLRDMNVFRLNGYHADERMTGGTSYRIHMEFASGEKLNADWFTHNPLPLAAKAYSTILRHLMAATKRREP